MLRLYENRYKIILGAIRAFKGRIQRQGNKTVMQTLTAETSDSTILLWQKIKQ